MMGNRKRLKNVSKAQAMVEFALIATVLLMLIFIVIEAARILWAWNTVQNSAREGIRFAITGQTLGNDFCPVEGLPKFENDVLNGGRDVCNFDDNNRVASIIANSHTALSGLPLNETSNAFEDDNYYNIEVWGVNPDAETEEKLIYDFGGLPNFPVVVRVTYRVPIITPLLRPIAQSVPVFGQVALNNENFGSLSSGNVGQGLPPQIPPIPTPGVTPSPTPTPTDPPPPTAGPSPTASQTATATATATAAICPVNFVQPPVANQTSVLVTGEIGAFVEVYDISTVPATLLEDTVLLDRPGYLCGGFADFVPSAHPALSIPLIEGHQIEVIQYINGVQHSTDTAFVLAQLPTSTPTETNTPAPTPTETGTATVTPTNTPGSPFIVLIPDCGGDGFTNVTVNVIANNFPDDEDVSIFWDFTQFQNTILAENHSGFFNYSFPISSPPVGTYLVRAVSDSVDVTAPFDVPCDDFVPTPVTSTPTSTPRPIDLVIVSPPELVSTYPITAYTPVDFSVVITNTGDVDVNSQFFVDIYLDPTDVFTNYIPIEQSSGYSAVSSLAGGESKVLTITSQLGFANDPDNHQVYGMVDSAGAPGSGQVFEDDETNNVSPPQSVTGITDADTPTPTPTIDPSGVNIIAGTVNSRVIEWATQFRAVVTLLDSSGNVFSITDSDENGYYQFLNVPDDTYTVYACIDIDGISYFGVRLGIVPPNTVANIYMLPGPCGVSGQTNQPPNVTHPGDQYNLEGDAVSLQITATDPENDTMTYSAIGLPPGLSINSTTGEIFGVIANGFAGQYPVGVTVDDGTNQTNLLFTWYVLEDELRFESFRVLNVGSAGWTTVTTQNQYIDMVVVCSSRFPNSSPTPLPRVVRIQNADSGNSFNIRLQNPNNGIISPSTVDCMVMEAGAWQLPDGRNIEGQKYVSTTTDFDGSWVGQTRLYSQLYINPVVFGQVMSYNDPNWSTFWSMGGTRTLPPTALTLFTGKHVGEDPVRTRADETIGIIVVEAGGGTVDSQVYRTALGGDFVQSVVQSAPDIYTYSSAFPSTPTIAVVSQAGMDGSDGSWAYTYGPSPFTTTQLRVSVDEDYIDGVERNHTGEQVSYFVFEREVVLP